VAKAFPNEESVNEALLSLIKIAKKTANPTKASVERTKKLSAG